MSPVATAENCMEKNRRCCVIPPESSILRFRHTTVREFRLPTPRPITFFAFRQLINPTSRIRHGSSRHGPSFESCALFRFSQPLKPLSQVSPRFANLRFYGWDSVWFAFYISLHIVTECNRFPPHFVCRREVPNEVYKILEALGGDEKWWEVISNQ